MTDQIGVLSSHTLLDTDVVNPQGEGLGDLEEIMLDTRTGSVAYAVISFGGLLGIGDKYFAVPWEALTIDRNSEKIVLDVDKERLENAPGFDKGDWPSTANLNWLERVHSHYGYSYHR